MEFHCSHNETTLVETVVGIMNSVSHAFNPFAFVCGDAPSQGSTYEHSNATHTHDAPLMKHRINYNQELAAAGVGMCSSTFCHVIPNLAFIPTICTYLISLEIQHKVQPKLRCFIDIEFLKAQLIR